MFRFFTGLALGLVVATPAFAASLIPTQGTVSVNTGDGFRTIATAQEINPGDRIVLPSGSTAQISYPGGCAVDLSVPAGAERQVVVVQPAAQAFAAAGPTTNVTAIAIGAGVIAGGAGLAIALSGSDNDSSPSP
ncbi:MAG: hypothetical protein AAFR23_02295 [Pseudomonadota bacterium]